MDMINLVGYFAMGMSILSFAFAKQKLVRATNLFACLVWVWYGFLIQNNPSIITNIMVVMVHSFWFIKRWSRISKLNRK